MGTQTLKLCHRTEYKHVNLHKERKQLILETQIKQGENNLNIQTKCTFLELDSLNVGPKIRGSLFTLDATFKVENQMHTKIFL